MNTNVQAQEALLRVIHYTVAQEISRHEILDSVVPELLIENTARGLVLSLTAGILGRKASQTYLYPATWWDAFKVRWFRGLFAWALRRWPARFVEFSAETTELFPDLKPTPGMRSVVLRSIEPVPVERS